MVSSAITPTRTIAVLIGVAVLAVAGFAVVRSGVFDPGTVQGAIPGPGSSSAVASPSVSASASTQPSAPASPSATTPEQIKAQNIADAKARLVEYYEATASIANNGYEGWRETLVPFWGSFAIRDAMSIAYTQSMESGQYTTGAARIASNDVTSYNEAERGYEEVGLEVCVDFSAVRTFEAGGDEVKRQAGAPKRYYLEYVMRHHGESGVWAINAEERHLERAC